MTSSVTSSRYMLNTSLATQAEAQAACNLQGGHLASYGSLEEQYEVEQYFVTKVRSCSSEAQMLLWAACSNAHLRCRVRIHRACCCQHSARRTG
jgi:hypothetical protein